MKAPAKGFKRKFALSVTLLLMACGKPDASGIYVAKFDREIMLVQLVQGDDGKLTGRFEASTMANDGTVSTKDGVLEGSVSGHELMLKPASIWQGGIQASGSFTDSRLTLTGKGFSLGADRSSLEAYQEAVAKLQASAGDQREKVATANAAIARTNAERQTARDVADRQKKVSALSAALHQYAAKLTEAVSRSPNFSQQAVANTIKVRQLAARAKSQSDDARNQIAVAANQIEVGTNQIEVVRSQYAIGLNAIVDDASQAASSIGRLCGEGRPAALNGDCNGAEEALKAFKQSYSAASATFNRHKAKVQEEMDRQSALVGSIEG